MNRQSRIINCRPSRRLFIDGQSPLLLVCTSHRASMICQPREFCYLQPVNGLRNFPSSVVLRPYLRPIGVWCILLFSLHSYRLYPHSILCIKILYSGVCTSVPGISRISSDCSFKYPMELGTDTFGGISNSICTRSTQTSASTILTFFHLHSVHKISPISSRFSQ